MLRHFYDFENGADIVGKSTFLSRHCHTREELSAAAQHVRQCIMAVLDQWDGSGEDKALYAKILPMNYIQKIGIHEVIAARLNLSLSTYYRQLKISENCCS